MLVLSRKENEKVLFPHLGIALQILRVGGGKVRLGIEAPGDVAIIRHEIASPEQLAEFSDRLQRSASGGNHEVRNRLHTTLLGLSLVHTQLARNLVDDAEETLQQLIDSMRGLDCEIGNDKKRGNNTGRINEKRTNGPSPRTALVVEDNSNERRLLAGYLSLSGFKVEAVDDGIKALDYLASHDRPEAVVMDMQLPRLGGAEAVGVLRADPRFHGLKVYAVSGMDPSDIRLSVGPGGVDHWFTKPLDPRQLVERINAEMPAVA